MINVTEATVIPSVSTTLGILRNHNRLMPTFLDFDKTCMYLSYLLYESNKMREPLYEALKCNKSISLNNGIINYLYRTGNASGFKSTKTGISLAKDSVAQAFESGLISAEAKDVVTLYQKYANYTKTARTLEGLLQFPVIDMISYDGHRMLMVHPKWAAQNTGRVAMYDPAIQNLPRTIQDLVTVPKGWVLKHVDSGQIEPRVIYSTFMNDPQIKVLINLYDDAYYGLLHYVTMPYEFIRCGTLNFEKKEITDDMKVLRSTIKTYCNSVMYGSKSNPSNDPIKAALIERIGKHPLRLKRIADIEEQVDRGVTVFKTWFGTPIDISKSNKLEFYEGESVKDEMIKLAINNPIQGTAADLMRLSVSTANKLLASKAKNSVILNYIHDAGTFAIHESDLDAVGAEIDDIVSYNVPGWIPIKSEGETGRPKGLFPDYY